MAKPVYLVTPNPPAYLVTPWPDAEPDVTPEFLDAAPTTLAAHELATAELGT